MTSWSDSLFATAASNSVVALGLACLAVLAGRWSVTRATPTIAHCLWVLVLAKLVTPPMFAVEIPIAAFPRSVQPTLSEPDIGGAGLVRPPIESASSVIPPSRTHAPARRETLHSIPMGRPQQPIAAASPTPVATWLGVAEVDWRSLLLGTWLFGSLLTMGIAGTRAVRFQRGLRRARPASAAIRREVRHLSRTLGLRRAPRVQLLPGKHSPMLWGFFGAPRILLPAILEHNLDPERRRTLLAHELAHQKRRDHWVRALEMVVRAVYWWNPLVYWACRRLREVEEECCDAWVVWALPEASREYADALLDTVEFLSDAKVRNPAPASGIGNVTNLKRRLIMIMQGGNRRSSSNLARTAVLGLATLTLPLVPAIGQSVRKDRAPEPSAAATRTDQNIDQKKVIRALDRAIGLLRRNGRGDDAEALLSLLHKIQHSAAHTADHAPAATTVGIERRIAEISRALRAAERAGRQDQVDELRRALAQTKAHAADVHAQATDIDRARADRARARDRRNVIRTIDRNTQREARDRGDGADARSEQRIQRLEDRLDRLTRTLEKLLHERQTDSEPTPPRVDRFRMPRNPRIPGAPPAPRLPRAAKNGIEEIEVIEEEEMEEEEEIEEEIEEGEVIEETNEKKQKNKEKEAKRKNMEKSKKKDEAKRRDDRRRARDAIRAEAPIPVRVGDATRRRDAR